MKPLHFLFIAAAAGALSSCGSMNDPIYYGDGEAKVTEVSQQSLPPVAQGDTPTPVTANVAPANKKPQAPRKTSPFMLPNVFDMPKTEDLKETPTSTRNNSGSHGLTVPNR
ncbi:hypothetical protein [Rubritalea profundi]|uniref:Lipoprotein n=1 Tax=Rubritalea profundi TaxID=1658618 RepID=A0A2S7TX50_9BACT|nr:hypothetical protein [Rubritalea profundi]PQJ27336.1 hypothetical protein BSZ32_01720 [Rubritalea profundi]